MADSLGHGTQNKVQALDGFSWSFGGCLYLDVIIITSMYTGNICSISIKFQYISICNTKRKSTVCQTGNVEMLKHIQLCQIFDKITVHGNLNV